MIPWARGVVISHFPKLQPLLVVFSFNPHFRSAPPSTRRVDVDVDNDNAVLLWNYRFLGFLYCLVSTIYYRVFPPFHSQPNPLRWAQLTNRAPAVGLILPSTFYLRHSRQVYKSSVAIFFLSSSSFCHFAPNTDIAPCSMKQLTCQIVYGLIIVFINSDHDSLFKTNDLWIMIHFINE